MSSITKLENQPELGTELVRIVETESIPPNPTLRIHENTTEMIALAQKKSSETARQLMNVTTIEKCKMKIIRILMERGFVLETKRSTDHVNLNLLEFISSLNKTWEKKFKKGEIFIIDKQLFRRTFELLASPGDDYSTSLTIVRQNLDTWRSEIVQKRTNIREVLSGNESLIAEIILSFTGDKQIETAITKHQEESARQAPSSTEIASRPTIEGTYLPLLFSISFLLLCHGISNLIYG